MSKFRRDLVQDTGEVGVA